MKRKSCGVFVNMVYPMFLSLFLFYFATAFVTNKYLELLQVIAAILTAFFGVLFLIGLIFEIVHFFTDRKEK